MRLFPLLVAATCGAFGAVSVLNSGAGPISLSMNGAALLAALSDAEIGVVTNNDSPFAVVDGPLAAEEIAVDKLAHSDAADVASEPAPRPYRDDGLLAQLISSSTPKTGVGARTATGWVVVGNSVQNRPLHIKTVGTGSHKTLLIAGLDGEDRIAVNWVDQWVQQLHQSPETLRDYQLIFLRAANPDGLTAKHLENARGVALNHNFPTAGYRPGGNPSAGLAPASEPETRTVLQLLYDLRPQRVVHLVAAAGASEAICNGVAEEAATSLSDVIGMKVESFDPHQQAGSLEEFAATVLGIEVVTLRLRIGEDWRSAAVAHYPTFLTGAVPQLHRAAFAQSARSRLRRAVEDGDEPVSATSVGRRQHTGYEELPPPPNKRGR